MSGKPVESEGTSNFAVMSMLSRGQGKMEQAITFVFAATTMYKTVQKWRKNIRARYTYSITVRDDDAIYPDVHMWIINNMPVPMQRSVIVRSGEVNNYGEATIVDSNAPNPNPNPTPSPLRYLFDGDREQVVKIEGYDVLVSVSSKSDWNKVDKFSVKFTCQGIDSRKAVVNLLSQIAASRATGKRIPRLYLADKWGGWNRRDDLIPRQLDSVILADGVKERLLADFQNFKEHEPDFVRLGVPYHRGYLFYGPPGSGKTSIAKAIASEFGMDVYYMPLSDIASDADLLTMVSRVPAGCVLLLEDVDVAHAAKERDDEGEQPKATLSGLLNAIDGVATPHGLIVVMTTNKRDALDAAVIRPGRVDLELHIDYVTETQLTDMFRHFTGLDVRFDLKGKEISSADVVGSILRHIDDKQAAVEEVRTMIG